jgi:hypothetical protein
MVRQKVRNSTERFEDTLQVLEASSTAPVFSLDEIGVPEGAEVWLSFRIAGGDKEGCRKDNTKLYATGSKGKRQYYWSKGTTLNGNRCRLWKYVGTSASCKGTFTPDDCDSRCTSC